MDAVDMRHDQFTQIYTGLIQTELSKRGVSGQEYHFRDHQDPTMRLD